MTDRDFFAGCALMGELSTQTSDAGCYYTSSDYEALAKRSFEIADAMMRQKQRELWPEDKEEPCPSMSGSSAY